MVAIENKIQWFEATLNDVCVKITDGAHLSPKSVANGMPMASVKDLTSYGINIDSCRQITKEDYDKLVRQGCQPLEGDVLIAKDGATALDTVCVVKKTSEVVLLSSVAILRPDRAKIDSLFLRYYLDSETTRSYMKGAYTTGAAIPRVVLKDFKLASIKFASLPVQRKIAAILSAYDDLIENNLRRIKILEEMEQNLYREWFVKFRFPGHEQARFVDSPLGRIPEGWEVVNFGDLYLTSSGGTPSRKVADYYTGDHPWVKTRELNDGFIFETEETITDLGLKQSSAKLFPENTVILAIYGATIGKLGILSMRSATNQACVAILPKEAGFGRAFAFLFLRENRDKLIGLGQGAAQQNISQVLIKNFPTLRMPDDLIQDFSDCVEPLFDSVKNRQQRNQILRRTRDLLLPRLISGEVDVSELDIAIAEEALA